MERTYELLTPIEINGQDPIRTLTFKEPDLNALEQLDKCKGGIEMTKVLICKTTGLEPGEVGRIKARDIPEIEAIIEDLMGKSLVTGER